MKKLSRIYCLVLLLVILTTNSCFAVKAPNVLVDVYAADKGWMMAAEEGEDAGTTGQSRQLEAIRLQTYDGSEVEYRVELAGKGWTPWVNGGAVAGSPGGGNAIVAIQIKRDDGDSIIAYRTHIAEVGWVGYVYGPKISGIHTNRIEAITIQFPMDR